jgi:hypothetical protein
MSTIQFAALVLAHDDHAPAKIACHIDLNADAANDDSGYLEWIEEMAEMENMRNARW